MKWLFRTAKKGDMLRVSLGTVYHYGIYVSDDEVISFGGLPENNRVAESVKVLTTDIRGFSGGRTVETAVLGFVERLKRFTRSKTVELARARIGEGGYNLLHNNCEHFVYECVFGIKKSTQEDEARYKWRHRPILDIYIVEAENADSILTISKNTLLFALKKSYGYKPSELKIKACKNGFSAKNAFGVVSYGSQLVVAAVSDRTVYVKVNKNENDGTRSILVYNGGKRGKFTDNESTFVVNAIIAEVKITGDNLDRTAVYTTDENGFSRLRG